MLDMPACGHVSMINLEEKSGLAIIVSMVSQKGGVGKSTLARLLAREFATQDWRVNFADLDISQGTSFQWRARRLEDQIEPDVPVEQFGRVDQALKIGDQYDLLIFDGAPHGSQATRAIAQTSDLTVIRPASQWTTCNPPSPSPMIW